MSNGCCTGRVPEDLDFILVLKKFLILKMFTVTIKSVLFTDS